MASAAANAGSPGSGQCSVSVLPALVGGGKANVVGRPGQQLPVTQQEVPIQLWHGWSSSQLLEDGTY